jgi:hypothetical protein
MIKAKISVVYPAPDSVGLADLDLNPDSEKTLVEI